MFDIVGKRNWYFAFSALITIPGLIFIVLGGLKPSVDYTGGTVWQIRYASEPSAADVLAALVELDHPEARVTDVGGGFLEIRTDPIDLLPPTTPLPSVSIVPTPTVTPSATAAPTASPVPSASESGSVEPMPSPTPTPTPSPSPTATPVPTATPAPTATPPPIYRDTPFDELQVSLIERFGEGEPRRITTVGPIVGAGLVGGCWGLSGLLGAVFLGYPRGGRSVRFSTALSCSP